MVEMSENNLSTGKKISFAIGNIGGLAIGQSSILLLYSYYFLYLGVPLSPIGISLILVVYGVWDAFNEPLIGHISDFTRTKMGRRKPFILIGLVPLVICSYLIYTPPINDPIICSIYLIIILILYETFVTMVVTIWFSLFPELSLDQKDRLVISRFLQIFGIFGLILGIGVAPLIAGFFSDPFIGYSLMGLILGLITALSMVPTLIFIKEKKEYQIIEEKNKSFFKSIVISLKNKSFRYFVLVQFLLQLSYSVVLSGLPLFFEGVLGLETFEWSIQLLFIFLTVIPSLFLWVKVAERKGTKYSLFLSMISFAIALSLVFLIFNSIISMIVLLITGVGLAGVMMFPTILLSDVIDEDQLITNQRREGIFNGVSGVIVKLSNAISWLVLGIIIELFQIDRNNLTPTALTLLNEIGLRILVGLIPILIVVLGLYCLYKYPLSGERLEEVKERVKKLNLELVK
ncbi:MAG: MFS transporter [Promethearchaeota archaeon]|nr:MAG: MFS transporter [Candidatus Lokiarchaeota archaeon]